MNKDSIKVRGQVKIEVIHPDGTRECTEMGPNVITNAALAVFSGLVGNTGAQTAFTYLALGTDATAASASQTTLVAEITDTGLARKSATISRTTTIQTNDTLNLVTSWTASGVKGINEIGVFNAASSGVMAARKVSGSSGFAVTISTINGSVVNATYQIIFS